MPKQLIGTLKLLPLPGSLNFQGSVDAIIMRAEQEALALASGGVDAILVENTYDVSNQSALSPLAVLVVSQILRQVDALTALPMGLSLQPNQTEAMVALAQQHVLKFMMISGLVSAASKPSQYASLLTALQVGEVIPSIWLNLSQQDLEADVLQQVNWLNQLLVSQPNLPTAEIDTFIIPIQCVEKASQLSDDFHVYLKGRVVPKTVDDVYRQTPHGLILGDGVEKNSFAGVDPYPAIDPVKVETLICQIRPRKPQLMYPLPA